MQVICIQANSYPCQLQDLQIRRSYDRLISTMVFPIPVRQHLYIESGPRLKHHCDIVCNITCPVIVWAMTWPYHMLLNDSKNQIKQKFVSDKYITRNVFAICSWLHSLVFWYLCDLCGPWFNIRMSFYQYRKSYCGDKTILRPSFLHNGISFTGKTTSLYWIGALYP